MTCPMKYLKGHLLMPLVVNPRRITRKFIADPEGDCRTHQHFLLFYAGRRGRPDGQSQESSIEPTLHR